MKAGELVLAAEDAEDLEIMSAHLQDAVARIKDLAYLPKKRRFAAIFNRFKWEKPERGREGGNLRVQSGLHFDNVLSVKSRNIRLGAPNAVVSLLMIRYEPRSSDDGAGTVELLFSGGGAIRLEVECIEAMLSDLTGAWAARGRPVHEAG
jgi:DUF2948 family protein